MITFSRKKAAAQLSFRPSLLTVAACTSKKFLQENAVEHGAEQSLRHSFNPKFVSHKEQCSDDPADMAHAEQRKVPKTVYNSCRPEDMQQQPDAAPVVKTRRHTALPHTLSAVPSGQKPAKDRYMPPAPITAPNGLAEKHQQGPRTSATPLTDPDTWSGSTEPEMSSGISASGTVLSSDDDASSYAPSSRGKASPGTGGIGMTVARPPLHPRTISKHGHNAVQRQTNMPGASDDAAQPGNHESKTVQPQENQGNHDDPQESLPPAAKRHRRTKTVLQKADLHVSKAAVRSMTAPDALLVEMPPGFDVTGDTGSIGRVNATSSSTNASVEMDIKGTMYRAVAAPCASSLLLVRVTNTGDGAGGAAIIELATNEFVQATPLESNADLAARMDWSDEEYDYTNLPVGAAEAKAPKGKATAPKAKAKGPKAAAKRKLHTKTASRRK